MDLKIFCFRIYTFILYILAKFVTFVDATHTLLLLLLVTDCECLCVSVVKGNKAAVELSRALADVVVVASTGNTTTTARRIWIADPVRSVGWYRWGLRRPVLPFGWDRLDHQHRLRDRRQPVTGAGAYDCAFHHRDRPALANGKANGVVMVVPWGTPKVVPSGMELPGEMVAVEEIGLVAVIVRFASVAVASYAVELEDPSLGHRDPAGVVGRER